MIQKVTECKPNDGRGFRIRILCVCVCVSHPRCDTLFLLKKKKIRRKLFKAICLQISAPAKLAAKTISAHLISSPSVLAHYENH